MVGMSKLSCRPGSRKDPGVQQISWAPLEGQVAYEYGAQRKIRHSLHWGRIIALVVGQRSQP